MKKIKACIGHTMHHIQPLLLPTCSLFMCIYVYINTCIYIYIYIYINIYISGLTVIKRHTYDT